MAVDPNDFWQDWRVDHVKAAWAAGKSTVQIGDELGCTRNTISGKIKRLALPLRREQEITRLRSLPAPSITPRPANPPKPRAKPRPPFQPKFEPTADILAALPPERLEDRDIPLAQRKTIFELTSATCKWPCGTPGQAGFFFCGGKVLGGCEPYCSRHAKIAWSGLPARRRSSPDYIPPRVNY